MDPTYKLALKCYSLTGKLEFERPLLLPGEVIVAGGYSAGSVSKTGLFATALATTKTEPSTTVRIFDNKGKLVKNLGSGDSPAFSPDGNQLAFWRDAGDSRDVILYDVKAGTTAVLGLQSPLGRDATLAGLSWSPDGKWLMCSYAHGYPPRFTLYATRATGATREWIEFPMPVAINLWTATD